MRELIQDSQNHIEEIIGHAKEISNVLRSQVDLERIEEQFDSIRHHYASILTNHKESTNLEWRTYNAVSQFTRYRGGVYNEKFADILDLLTNVNDDLKNGRNINYVKSLIDATKKALDELFEDVNKSKCFSGVHTEGEAKPESTKSEEEKVTPQHGNTK